MRIAVASKDGRIVNQHFGHAKRFLIFELDETGRINLVEERPVDRYCPGDEEAEETSHPFEEDRFTRVYSAIKDCEYLLVARIGPTPEEKLRQKGIKTITCYDYLEEGIKIIIKGKKG